MEDDKYVENRRIHVDVMKKAYELGKKLWV